MTCSLQLFLFWPFLHLGWVAVGNGMLVLKGHRADPLIQLLFLDYMGGIWCGLGR